MMKRGMKIAVTLAMPAILLSLVSLQIVCQNGAAPPKDAQSTDALHAGETITTTAATTLPAGPISVRVSIMMVIHKEYGALAHLMGKRNVTVTDEPYEAGKSWWDNPMVIHKDVSFPNSAVSADANSAPIAGRGQSANVSVEMTLVPHAEITLKTPATCDCIKGTLTATITTVSEYYDGKWTRVAAATDQKITFNFDNSDKSMSLRQTITETRTMPSFSFERYTRDRQKWEPKSAWPADPQSGDWRCAIYVKDAKLMITGYEYFEGATGQKSK